MVVTLPPALFSIEHFVYIGAVMVNCHACPQPGRRGSGSVPKLTLR